MRIRDALGCEIEVEPPARRIVSLVPSLTELVCFLGLGHTLAGVTRYCVEPPAVVDRLPKVGGTKNPDLQAILRLHPDLILANAEENRREDVESLRRAGLRVFVTYPRSLRDVAQMVQEVGALISSQARVQNLVAQILAPHPGFEPQERPVRVFCPIWKNPWMSFNCDTYAHALLSCCGALNAAHAEKERYPVVDLRTIAEFDPEIILLPDEPYRFSRKDVPELAPLAQTSAARSNRIYFVSGKALTWFGPRTAGARRYFAQFLSVI
ncbi:MAG: helical backbone metal receptor [Candidatus Binatia bacterium]|nr:helical backbone metal receptor [Candidatus Binatia bacterium]